jgi:hypothetical protein
MPQNSQTGKDGCQGGHLTLLQYLVRVSGVANGSSSLFLHTDSTLRTDDALP